MTADPFHAGPHPGGYSQNGKVFIAAASGIPVNLLEPDPDTITLPDVARGLSMTCRFAGHVNRFYSVAEHSCLVLGLVRAAYPDSSWELDAWALLHDAQEAYIHDVTGPLKHAMGLLQGPLRQDPYSEIEARWTEAIRVRFSLPLPESAIVHAVKHFDHYAACLEGGRLKPQEPFYSRYTDEPIPDDVNCAFGLPQPHAERHFLARCEALSIR